MVIDLVNPTVNPTITVVSYNHYFCFVDIRSRKKSSAPPAARTSRKSHSTDRDPNRKSKKMPPAKGFFKSLLKKGMCLR